MILEQLPQTAAEDVKFEGARPPAKNIKDAGKRRHPSS